MSNTFVLTIRWASVHNHLSFPLLCPNVLRRNSTDFVFKTLTKSSPHLPPFIHAYCLLGIRSLSTWAIYLHVHRLTELCFSVHWVLWLKEHAILKKHTSPSLAHTGRHISTSHIDYSDWTIFRQQASNTWLRDQECSKGSFAYEALPLRFHG